MGDSHHSFGKRSSVVSAPPFMPPPVYLGVNGLVLRGERERERERVLDREAPQGRSKYGNQWYTSIQAWIPLASSQPNVK